MVQHIAAQDPGADVRKPSRHKVIVGSKRIMKVLVGAGSVTIKGDGEAVDAKFSNWQASLVRIRLYSKNARSINRIEAASEAIVRT